MSCDQCGSPCQGRLCELCETAQAAEKLHGTVDEPESDDDWQVVQTGLGDRDAAGQTTLDGDVVPDGGDGGD